MSYTGNSNMDPNDKPKLTELQKQVADMADDILSNSAWYHGIYIAEMPSDEEILARGFEVVAKELAETTSMLNY